MKQLYRARFTFLCQYTQGWIFKKEKVETAIFVSSHVVLAKNSDEAKDKFKERNDYWINNHVPWGYLGDWDNHPSDYDVIDKSIDVISGQDLTLEYLKDNMRSEEFLEYCRQELIDPKEVVS